MTTHGNEPAYLAAPVPLVSRKVHTLKTLRRFLIAIGNGNKTFEVRVNDRDFRVGDILHLREWDTGDSGEWGPLNVTCFVSYILGCDDHFAIKIGYVVMGIKLPANHSWPPLGLEAQ